MKINEVCNVTGLTKKAIEYYQQKGIINPNLLKANVVFLERFPD